MTPPYTVYRCAAFTQKETGRGNRPPVVLCQNVVEKETECLRFLQKSQRAWEFVKRLTKACPSHAVYTDPREAIAAMRKTLVAEMEGLEDEIRWKRTQVQYLDRMASDPMDGIWVEAGPI